MTTPRTTAGRRARPGLTIAAGIIVLSLGPAITGQPASADTGATPAPQPLSDTSLVVDEANILDDQRVVDALNQLERTGAEPDARVAVFTTDDVDQADYDVDVTTELVELAPEGIITDGRLDPNVVLVTISPESRMLGIYAGDGLPDAHQADHASPIEDMRPHARDGDWDNTAFVGANSYLTTHEIIAHSDPQNGQEPSIAPVLITFGVILALPLLTGLVALIGWIGQAGERRAQHRREKALVDAFLKKHPRSRVREARDAWRTIGTAHREHPEVFEHFSDLDEYTIATRRALCHDLAEGHRPDVDAVTDGRAKQALDLDQIRTDLHLAEVLTSDTDIGAAWSTTSDRIRGDLQVELNQMQSEARAMGLPTSVRSSIIDRISATAEAADTTLDEGLRESAAAVLALARVRDLRLDLDDHLNETITGLDRRQRDKITRPPGATRTRRNASGDSGHLWGLYAAAFLAGSTSTSSSSTTSSSYSSSGSSSSSSSSFSSGGFSGGGFSGGSGGF